MYIYIWLMCMYIYLYMADVHGSTPSIAQHSDLMRNRKFTGKGLIWSSRFPVLVCWFEWPPLIIYRQKQHKHPHHHSTSVWMGSTSSRCR